VANPVAAPVSTGDEPAAKKAKVEVSIHLYVKVIVNDLLYRQLL